MTLTLPVLKLPVPCPDKRGGKSLNIFTADIDLRQKCIHLRHNLFAPILLLCHLFVQAMDIICANKID
jgi:hypothetical protein